MEPRIELEQLLGGKRLILVSNREPYEHVHGARDVEVHTPPGGLVSALDPTMRKTHGIWIAWGSGSADRETSDECGRVQVPPDDPAYTLRRVWLDQADVDGYYEGFANSALWPLCHMLSQYFDPRSDYWDRYHNVNDCFARAVVAEAGDGSGAMLWIQDYHFALLPAMVRERVPQLFVHHFWHIPFPPPDIFQMLPGHMQAAVLRGMLGNDLLEFQTERSARNFLSCVAELIPDAEVDVDAGTAWLGEHYTKVGAFPISIDVAHFESLAAAPESTSLANTLRERYARDGRQLGVSVDRVDYTKGIPERLRAIDLMWEQHPELRERVTFVVVATPSRSGIAAYQKLEQEVEETVKAINARFETPDWTPLVLVPENVSADRLASIYRAADLCLVSSLQDGMNLVAKEFIACQTDERGVLLLSRFTGAAQEVEGAVLVNPFNVDGLVDGIREALMMPDDERRVRIHGMRDELRRATIFDWLRSILAQASEMRQEAEEARV
jgi:alpha,alpha-trehalose-phosphate synthase [UDP-forming]